MAAVTEKNLSHVERLLGEPAAAATPRQDSEGEGADRPAAQGRRPPKPGKTRRRRG